MTMIRVALAVLLWLGALVGALALLAEVSEEAVASFSAVDPQVAALPATLVTCVDPRAAAPALAPPAWMEGETAVCAETTRIAALSRPGVSLAC